MTTQGLDQFLTQLRARVSDKCTEVHGDPSHEHGPLAFREEGFTQVFLESLEEMGQLAGAEPCFLDKRVGRRHVRVNAWAFDEEERQLDLVSTIFNDADAQLSVPRSDLQRAARNAAAIVDAARFGLHEELEPASDAHDMIQRIHEVSDRLDRVRLILLVDGTAADPGALETHLGSIELKLEVWDHLRLFRAHASGLPYEPVSINVDARLGELLPCLSMPACESDYQAFLVMLPGDLLHSLYHEFGSRLLELNVRSFLMMRGKVNKGIRKTILEEPGRFMAYNNGLSITAESITTGRRPDGQLGIQIIRGLQVVNGGQTVATIHRTKQVDRADLSSVFVQAKITIIDPNMIDAVVPLVSRFANTQNAVNEADFSANSAFHVKLQQLSETVWCPGEATRWFYERARGQYQVARAREGTTPKRRAAFDARTPSRQKFDKVLVAKYVNAWDLLPHVVGRGGQKNFAAFTNDLYKRHGAEWEPDTDYFKRLVALAIIYKTAEKIARKHAFTGYRANAVAYTVSLVSWRTAGRVSLMDVWEQQAVSKALESTIDAWMPDVHAALVETAGTRNVTEWCKREECWHELQTLELGLPRDLEGELAAGQPVPTVGSKAGKEGQLTSEDRENIARVMQCDASSFLDIVRWGTQTALLKPWQLGIATTLASYAAMQWSKVPSAKQARQGVRILSLAAEHDVLQPDED